MVRNEKMFNDIIKNLYIKNEYIKKNPSLHEVDSYWKISKILPLIDEFIDHNSNDEINLLDVGGGAGLVLKGISLYIEKKYNLKVNKHSLDLSPSILEIQKKRNPDLKKALNEDICNTSLGNKEIDLTLMIDVLEHIPNPKITLEELKRISNFVIFKVPLEENLIYKTLNFIRRGKIRQHSIENMGHVNFYNYNYLKHQIEMHMGIILDHYFTNAFEYLLNSEHYHGQMSLIEKLINHISKFIFKISPKLSALISNDFIMILSRCY